MISTRYYKIKHMFDVTVDELPYIESPFVAASIMERCLSIESEMEKVSKHLTGNHFGSPLNAFPGKGVSSFTPWRHKFLNDVKSGHVLLIFTDNKKPFMPIVEETPEGHTPTNADYRVGSWLIKTADPAPPSPPAVTGKVSEVSALNGNLGWSSERRDISSYKAAQIKPGKITPAKSTETKGTSSTTAKSLPAATSIAQQTETKAVTNQVEDFILEMDCGGYPFDEAPFFKMEQPVERWKVRPTKNNGKSARKSDTSDTEKLKKSFAEYVDDQKNGLSSNEVEVLDNILRPSFGPNVTAKGMSGTEITSLMSEINSNEYKSHSSSYKISYHHLRPTWAYGDNDNNLFPVRPGHQTAGIHRWWDAKLASAPTSEQLQEMLSGDETPKVHKVSENNIGRIAERLRKKTPPKNLLIEMKCPEACPV